MEDEELIGSVEFDGNRTFIIPIAYLNYDTNKYVPIDNRELAKYFPNQGKVIDYANTINSTEINNEPIENGDIVSFTCRQSPNFDSKNIFHCKYVIDTVKAVNPPFIPVVPAISSSSVSSGYITSEEISTYLTIENRGFKRIGSDVMTFYLQYKDSYNEDRLCGPFEIHGKNIKPAINPQKYMISEYEYNQKDFEQNVITIKGRQYIMDSSFLNPRRDIDCMPDEILQTWFIDKIRNTIKADKDYDFLKDFFLNTKAGEKGILETTRLDRVQNHLVNLEITYENLCAILENETSLPLLGELQKSYDNYKEQIKNEVTSSSQAQLKQLETQVEKTKKVLAQLEKTLENKADENGVDITQILSVLKEQTAQSSNLATQPVTQKVIVEKKDSTFDIDCSFSFDKRNEKDSKDNMLLDIFKDNILAARACFIPGLSVAYNYAKVIGNSKIFEIHTEHDWVHYSDFTKHGLIEIWNYAHNNPTENVILILDCINLTFVEGGLKPLLDVIDNQTPILLETKLGYPKNLKILATVVSADEDNENRTGLKLNENLFNKWAAYPFSEKAPPLAERFLDPLPIDIYYTPEYLHEQLNTDLISKEERNKYYEY